ncbi:unnamed protein product, partial [Gongylonema pulchrum]|uniref:ATP-grasp domain-containing protein n=1 Tax=Gongylonema pulchrum TaxID=637853 RepID=A0A183D194_9BILA
MQKVRELAANYGSTRRIIVAFEAELQYMVAKIRLEHCLFHQFELGIEGILPDQVEQVVQMKEMKLIARRNGLMTLRQIVMSLSAEPSSWLERIAAQLGGFPVFIRSCSSKSGHETNRCSIHNYDELQSWIKSNLETENLYNGEYVVEECLRDGYEFVSLCATSDLICTITKMSSDRTLFESIRDQRPYVYEYLTVEQTRDVMPGVESFVLRTAKSLPALSNSSFMFIKGFYR